MLLPTAARMMKNPTAKTVSSLATYISTVSHPSSGYPTPARSDRRKRT